MPAHGGMQVGEQKPGAPTRELPGAVQHVGFEHSPHTRPVRGQCQLPVLPEQFGDLVAQPGRLVETEGIGHRPPGVGDHDVGDNLLRRRAPHELQLRLEVGYGNLGARREKVGDPTSHSDERGQRPHVQVRQIRVDPVPPRHLEHEVGRQQRNPQAHHGLHQRGDREPHADEIFDVQVKLDHRLNPMSRRRSRRATTHDGTRQRGTGTRAPYDHDQVAGGLPSSAD